MRRAGAVALGACMMAAGEAFAAGPDDTDSEKRETWKIEGTVTDKNSEPIVGAAILERGTTNGTVTDTLGRFRLTVKQNAVLRVSYLGYTTQDVVVRTREPLAVVLEEENEELDEVVVIGYGAVKRENFTGSVSTVEMSKSPLSLLPNTNPMDALRGTVTGLTVSQQQGAGQAPSLQVRG